MREKVLKITREVVERNNITTLMVTHNMKNALELGNRTIMMDSGRIVLDIGGEERKGLSVENLLEKFRAGAGKALDNDRILLSHYRKNPASNGCRVFLCNLFIQCHR